MNTYLMANKRSQAGSTLIPVLLILVVITIVGVIAMKQGLTSLNIATNSQIQTVLAESSDAAINQFSRTDLTTITNVTGVLGAAINNPDPGQEYVFCFRPTSSDPFGLTVNSSILQGDPAGGDTATQVNYDSSSFCDLTATTDFGSGRKAAVTQVAVTIPLDASVLPPLSGLSRGGTDISAGSPLPKSFTTQQRIRVTATSMLPAFSTTDLATVNTECLRGRISDNADTPLQNSENLTDCLARRGVPANTQVQEFNLQTTLTGP